MKNKIYLLFLLLIPAFNSQAQKAPSGNKQQINTSYFDLDISLPDDGALIKSSPGRKQGKKKMVAYQNDVIVFRIKNSNPLRFAYEINENLVNMNYDEKDYEKVINALKTQTEKNEPSNKPEEKNETPNDKLKAASEKLKEVSGANASFEKTTEEKATSITNKKIKDRSAEEKEFIQNISTYKEKSKKIDEYTFRFYNATRKNDYEEINNLIDTYNTEASDLNEGISNYPEYKDKLYELDQAIQYAMEALGEHNVALTKFDQEVSEFIKQSENYINEIKSFCEKACLTYDTVRIKNHIIVSDKLKNDIDSKFEKLADMKFGDKSPSSIGLEIKKFKENVLYNSESAAGKQIKTFEEEFSIAAINLLIDNAQKKIIELYSINSEIATLPYTVKARNADFLRYELIVRDKETNNVTSKYKYDIYIRGGLKIDFSTGLMVSNLRDYNYTSSDTAGLKQVFRKNQGRMQFLVTTMVNVTYRWNEIINPTLSIGAGFSTDQKFQFLAGGGLSLSKFPRLILHGGIAFGPVKRLQSPFVEKGIYDLPGEAPTEDKFLYNWFFGITYNLSKVKAANTTEESYY